MSVAGLENEVSAVFGVDTTLASADVGLNLIAPLARSRPLLPAGTCEPAIQSNSTWSVTFFSLPPKAALEFAHLGCRKPRPRDETAHFP